MGYVKANRQRWNDLLQGPGQRYAATPLVDDRMMSSIDLRSPPVRASVEIDSGKPCEMKSQCPKRYKPPPGPHDKIVLLSSACRRKKQQSRRNEATAQHIIAAM